MTSLHALTWLEGTWEGEGVGNFPTLTPFYFKDKMVFTLVPDNSDPLIHFEETAWIIEKEKLVFKHWETGFFRPLNEKTIEWQVTHNTGRIEVLNGQFEHIDFESRVFDISFQSSFLRNAKGLVKAIDSRKRFEFKNGLLKYTHSMSTTEIPNLNNHLKAELIKRND